VLAWRAACAKFKLACQHSKQILTIAFQNLRFFSKKCN